MTWVLGSFIRLKHQKKKNLGIQWSPACNFPFSFPASHAVCEASLHLLNNWTLQVLTLSTTIIFQGVLFAWCLATFSSPWESKQGPLVALETWHWTAVPRRVVNHSTELLTACRLALLLPGSARWLARRLGPRPTACVDPLSCSSEGWLKSTQAQFAVNTGALQMYTNLFRFNLWKHTSLGRSTPLPQEFNQA